MIGRRKSNTGTLSAAAALAGSIMIATIATALADGVNNPKTWCGELTDLLASGQMEDAAAKIQDGSHEAINPTDVTIALAPLRALLEANPAKAQKFLRETIDGDAFAREWYLIVAAPKHVFIRCTFIKPDDSWAFTDLDFSDKVGPIAPQ